MIPLIITPCPRCGNADASKFHNGGDHVTCLHCGHVRGVECAAVHGLAEWHPNLYGVPVRDDAWDQL